MWRPAKPAMPFKESMTSIQRTTPLRSPHIGDVAYNSASLFREKKKILENASRRVPLWLRGCSCAGSPLYCASACLHLQKRKRLWSDRLLYYLQRCEWLLLCWIQPDVRIAFTGFCWTTQGSVRLNPDWLKGCCHNMRPPLPSPAPGLLSTTDPAPFLTRGAVLGMVISALRVAQRPFVCIDRCGASQPISQAGIIIYSCKLDSTARNAVGL